MPLWKTPDGMPPELMVIGIHPGDDRIHHIATLKYGHTKGDFTPEQVDQDVEVKVTIFGQFREHAAWVLGMAPSPGHLHARTPAAQQATPYRATQMEAG